VATSTHVVSFTLFSPSLGYIEGSLHKALNDALIATLMTKSDWHLRALPFLSLYDPTPPAQHPYTRASSAYSALVQLYARSSQLPTSQTKHYRQLSDNPMCSHGCSGTLESPHHLFVICPAFGHLREASLQALIDKTASILDDGGAPLACVSPVKEWVLKLFADGPVWPTISCQYFVGTLPTYPGTLPSRLRTRLYQLWHTECIKLAGRIWGLHARKVRGPVSSNKPEPLPRLPSFLESRRLLL